MKENLIIVLLNLIISATYAQSEKDIIELSPLKSSKIVLLGEQTHYDGAVFDKKVEIIKQLHEKLGFNIIIFESGMYDNYKAYKLYKNKKESLSIYNQSIYPIWTETSAFKELLDYVSQNPEMKILGFDSQEASLFKEYFISDLKQLLTQNSINISDAIYTKIEKTLAYRDIETYVNNKNDSLDLYNTFNLIENHISTIKNKNLDAKMIEQTFKSVVSDFDFDLKVAQKEKIYIQNPRDKQMAENLIFLQNQYPNEKIIAWGASYHFADKIDTFEYTATTEDYLTELHNLSKKLTSYSVATLNKEIKSIKELQYAIPMGKLLKKHYGKDVYSMGFTSYSGTYFGADEIEFPILEPPKNSLEAILYSKESKSKLIDKSEYPEANFYTSTLGYTPFYANWSNIFDGIYYIPKMYPPKYRDYNKVVETKVIAKKNNLEGIVKEYESNLPIPYVDVYYSSNNKSTIANSNGEFTIEKSKKTDNFLVFSTFGYKSDSIRIKDIKSTKPIDITLQKTENTTYLDEVVLESTKKLSAKDIIKRAEKRIKNNYVQTPFNQNFFYKVQEFNNDSLIFNEQALIETYFKKGNSGTNNPQNNIFGNILQLSNPLKKFNIKRERGTGNLWAIITKDIILGKTNVLYRSSSYDLKKDGVVEYNGKEVYQISFINNSPGSYSTGFGNPAPIGSKGIMYIDKKSFAVLYYEHCVTREKYTSKRFKNKFQMFHKVIQTYKEIDGKYFSNLFKIINKMDIYSKSDDTFLNSRYLVNYLMSTDIETQNVKPIERPIQNLKKNLKLDVNTNFWKENSFYIEDKDFKF